MKVKNLAARVRRLKKLARGFAVEYMVQSTAEGVLLPNEREDYQAALMLALKGFEGAGDALAGAGKRLQAK